MNQRITIEVHLDARRREIEVERLRALLSGRPRRIPSKYFYDRRGSALFEQITRLPEYYLTRAESALLQRVAGEISSVTAAEELVELGSGSAAKTRVLLDAMCRAGRLRLYVPFDVSETEVRRVAEELTAEYEELSVHGMIADFTHHLADIPPGDPRLVILLGSTIGNYPLDRAVRFLSRVSAGMAAGDFFLLGADLIKEAKVIEAAYNDSLGVTAEFNRNILRVLNERFDADFEPAAFQHRAFYDPGNCWIEMRLISSKRQRAIIGKLGLELELEAGEEILTEISAKYDRRRIESLLGASGFELVHWYTEEEPVFALALARKV